MLLAKNGRIDEMQRLVEEMKHYDLELNSWVYGVVIGAYADAGDRKKAEELFQEVKSNEKVRFIDAVATNFFQKPVLRLTSL
jgi:pentatricopeptide repeat protein